jgi:Reverse transcriptase (RNA-dependent DNA polymerase)
MFGPLADSTPKSFTDAINRPDGKQWWDALCAEIKAVIQNQTWDLVDLPPGKRAIPLKWVFRVKRDAKGNFEKYKARIVVKGYSQVAGLDFNETFAPVVRVESVCVIFAIAAANDLYILHIDCKNAFLNGESDVDIYVYQPEGFVDSNFPHKVLYLNKSLYGLKQAPHIWYLYLCGIIIDLGFVALESDPCIYIRGQLLVAVYVDDIKVVGNQQDCEAFYRELAKHIKVENQGPIKSFLGIDVIQDWDKHLIAINQSAYIDYLLADAGLSDAKSAGSPLDPSLPLLKAKPGDKMANEKYYQHVTGSLNHLAVYTRPDIAFAVSKLAQFNSAPTATHLKAAMHILRYLKGTRNLCLVYKRQPSTVNMVGYSDADWGSDENDRISYTGYAFAVHGGLASWSSHKQTTVANSTMQSEYMALSEASREAVARAQFFEELNIASMPVVLLSDNEAALDLADGTTTNHRKSKHIDIRYHQVCHFVEEGKVEVSHIASKYQIADIFRKALGPQRHQFLVQLMGMRNSYDLQ